MIVGPTNRLMIPTFRFSGAAQPPVLLVHIGYVPNQSQSYFLFCKGSSLIFFLWFFFSPSQINPFDSYENGDGCRLKMVYPGISHLTCSHSIPTIWRFPKMGGSPNHPFYFRLFHHKPRSYKGTPLTQETSIFSPSLGHLYLKGRSR